MILALAGGVGGAKLASGLAQCLGPEELVIAVNTGDDFEHLGLHISPDIDTVMYWLAGINDRERGWGIREETWNFIEALARLGSPSWFKLGDRDLATHVERTRLLRSGQSLSQVTNHLCRQLGVQHTLVPMTDASVRTRVHTDEGKLDFQDYFVRRQCQPRVTKIEFTGADKAQPSEMLDKTLSDARVSTIIICPSNPILSIDPVLSLPGVRSRIAEHSAPVIAVSPIIGNDAVKGPAAKIYRELGQEPSVLTVAEHYSDILDGLLIDDIDRSFAPVIEALGITAEVRPTLMKTLADQVNLARQTLEFATRIS